MAQRIRVTHLLLAGGLALAAQPAFAQEGMLFKNLIEGTFGRSEGADIDYRARAPLVVPPNSNLPPPQQAASSRNAAWPNDPDVQRRKDEANPRPYVEAEGARENPTLTPKEMRRVGRLASQPITGPMGTVEQNTYNNQILPIRQGRELAARQSKEAESTLLYGSEPQRRTLVEPPVGYRRPADSAALGPGRGGPIEDKQSTGERAFATGQGRVMQNRPE